MNTTKILTRCDMCADGGSVCVTYAEANCRFKLMFRISCEYWMRTSVPDWPRRTNYSVAWLKGNRPYQWTSPTTHITYDGDSETQRELSWNESIEILQELEPQIEGFNSSYRWVFAEMLHVAANEGTGLLRDSTGRVL